MNGQEQTKSRDIDLEKELLGIWQRALKNDNLTIDDDFFECGGDSLLATQIIMEIEELTGKSLPTSIIFETGSVRQLIKEITIDEFEPRKYFFMGSEKGKIIHFFHGDFAEGGFFIKIFSEMLGNDYLIHAIAPHLPHEENPPELIEEMAKERLPRILEEQPDGPYILLGRCNGALVSFEAARQLIAMGKEIKAMVMIDPTIMCVRRSAQFIFKTANFFMRLIGINESKRRQHLIWIFSLLTFLDSQTKDFRHRVLLFFQKTWPQKRTSINKLLKFIDSQRHEFETNNTLHYYLNAFLNYKPLPLNVPVLYISLEYNGYAWRRITRNIVYINICRGHHTSWKEDYSQDIVNRIREFISS